MGHSKTDYIIYRLEKSKETIKAAESQIRDNYLSSAQNRIYYAIFYAVSALAYKHDFSTSKHKQLLGWLNKNFIHTGILPAEYYQIYKNSFENRVEGDYQDFIEFSTEEVKDNFEEMKKFVEAIEKIIID